MCTRPVKKPIYEKQTATTNPITVIIQQQEGVGPFSYDFIIQDCPFTTLHFKQTEILWSAKALKNLRYNAGRGAYRYMFLISNLDLAKPRTQSFNSTFLWRFYGNFIANTWVMPIKVLTNQSVSCKAGRAEWLWGVTVRFCRIPEQPFSAVLWKPDKGTVPQSTWE